MTENEKLLFEEISKGNLEKVKTIIESGTNINIYDENNYTPFILSLVKMIHFIYQNKMKIIDGLLFIDMFLSAGADINLQDKAGWTALMHAVYHRQKDIVEKLVNNGADVDIQNNDGWTALMLATQNGDLDIINYLVGVDANINIQDKDGQTVIMEAVYKNYIDIVNIFLDKDVNIFLKNRSGQTALNIAEEHGHDAKIVKMLKTHIKQTKAKKEERQQFRQNYSPIDFY